MRTKAGQARQLKFKAAFQNPSTKITYHDGSVLHVTGSKSNLGDQYVGLPSVKSSKTAHTSSDPVDYDTNTSTVTLSASSTDFLNNNYDSNQTNIYPGAIYEFSDYFSGNMNPITTSRLPIQLYTDNTNISGSSIETVADPNAQNIKQAAINICRRLTGAATNQAFAFQTYRSSNTASLNMQIGGGASGFSVGFTDTFRHDDSSKTVSVTIDARKSLYTIEATPQADGGNWFSDASVENRPNLMVMDHVDYGIRVLANYNMTFDSVEDANNFAANYNSGFVDANVFMNYAAKHTDLVVSVNGYAIGGLSANANVSFNETQLKQQITDLIGKATWRSAKPISYGFRDMAGNRLSVQSATDVFEVKTSVPSSIAPLVTNVRLHFNTGRDDLDNNTRLVVTLYGEDDPQGKKPMFIYDSGYNHPKFTENMGQDVNMTQQNWKTNANTFIKHHGGRIHIDTFHDQSGSDTWIVNSWALIIQYADGKSDTYNGKGFAQSKGTGGFDLHFTKGSQGILTPAS